MLTIAEGVLRLSQPARRCGTRTDRPERKVAFEYPFEQLMHAKCAMSEKGALPFHLKPTVRVLAAMKV